MSHLYGLPFLRTLMADATETDARSVYDPDRLRFAVTVPPGAGDLKAQRARLAQLLNSDRCGLEPMGPSRYYPPARRRLAR